MLPLCGRLPSSPEVTAREDVDEQHDWHDRRPGDLLAAAEITPAGEVDAGEHASRRVSILIEVTVIVGLSLVLIFALGHPWRGPTAVSGHPIDAVIHALATGYFRLQPED